MTSKELQTLRSLGCEGREAADEIERLRAALAASCDEERSQMWEAGPSGGCSRAITAEAEVARLRTELLAAKEAIEWAQSLPDDA